MTKKKSGRRKSKKLKIGPQLRKVIAEYLKRKKKAARENKRLS
jgi:IS30 family transposase